MNNEMYGFLQILNEKIMHNSGILAIIEIGKIKEEAILDELDLKTDGYIISNIESIKKYSENPIEEDILEAIIQFFTHKMPCLKKKEKNHILLLSTCREFITYNRQDKTVIEFFNLIEHRRNHKLNVIILTKNFNHLFKHLRESCDIVLLMGNN